ncbi:MAG: peptidase M48 family protein [Sphingomonas taxi]|uniref:Peptidase M48 family protein n=1 Tax=Sphingomonas taxi TaxID=1549858 RepID=A0A2W5R3G8_9SPHN|nr:MAG: peptidase M48 family protein [Sphingomonas taxi]
MPFRLFLLLLAFVALPIFPGTAQAAPSLLDVDARLAAIAWRLTTANASLCRERQPVTGAVLHAADQYPPELRDTFAAPVAVELVVPDTPAARAGVVANDGLVAIDGRDVATAGAAGDTLTSATRDAAQARIAALPLDAPIALTLRRDGVARHVTVQPRTGCRVEFEVLAGGKLGASSDGRVVQVGGRLFETFADDQIAVVVAHELAHAVLRHRVRLEAAGVRWGLLSEFGRNGRLFRQTETEADLLGAYLLRNAGWDPQLAVRFWREHGGKIDGGLFRSRTHPSSKDRADAIAAELATMPANAPTPYLPPLLARRDAPLK